MAIWGLTEKQRERLGDGKSRFVLTDEQVLLILVWTRLYCSYTAHTPINPHNME